MTESLLEHLCHNVFLRSLLHIQVKLSCYPDGNCCYLCNMGGLIQLLSLAKFVGKELGKN